MRDLITAIGLILFIEGLVIALFPSKIKNMLKIIEKTPKNTLRGLGVVFIAHKDRKTLYILYMSGNILNKTNQRGFYRSDLLFK